MTFSRIEAALEPLADAARAASMSAYMRGRFAFLGIPTPERRAAVAPLLARRALDWPLVWACWDAHEREYQYVALDHLRQVRVFPAAHLDDLRTLIVTKSWWDTVDSLAKVAGSALGADGAEAAHVRDVIDAWATDENLWLRRVAIIHQLGFGAAAGAAASGAGRKRPVLDTARLTHAIEANLGSDEFFINKAIGWALRDYYRHAPDWVLEFCDSHELAPLSRREALKHVAR